jgi:hypothetical protein
LPDLLASLPNVPVGPLPFGGSDVVDDQLLDQDIRQAVDVQLAIDLVSSVRPGSVNEFFRVRSQDFL